MKIPGVPKPSIPGRDRISYGTGRRGGDREVDKIRDRLRPDEEILLVVTQKTLLKPSTYFVTNQRLMVRDPSFFSDEIQSLLWNDIGDVNISRGPMRSSIRFHRGGGGLSQSAASNLWNTLFKGGGGNVFTLESIKKEDAEKMYTLLEAYVREAKEAKDAAAQPQTQASSQSQQPQTPLDALKMKMINGEISEEEFERKRKLME